MPAKVFMPRRRIGIVMSRGLLKYRFAAAFPAPMVGGMLISGYWLAVPVTAVAVKAPAAAVVPSNPLSGTSRRCRR